MGFPRVCRSSEDQEVLFDQILTGQLDFPLPYWDNVSETAKVSPSPSGLSRRLRDDRVLPPLQDLIRVMLEVEVDQRFSALQVLEHPWVTVSPAVGLMVPHEHPFRSAALVPRTRVYVRPTTSSQ